MNQWVDIHSHILPDVDDGSESLEESIDMLKIAYDEGIHHIIATPHYRIGLSNPSPEELQNKLKAVQDAARNMDENFQIDLGNELYYSQDLIEHLEKGQALTLAGTKYVLIEFHVLENYKTMRAGLHQLIINGYHPILAHMERYECLYRNYKGINELIQLGVYMQLNISDITGNFLNRRTSFCKNLIEKGYIHFLSTDSHSNGLRAPRMREGLYTLRKKYGEEIINQLLVENTMKLLNNQYI